jgi:DNA-binding LytR/AlgR family response regulator
MKVDILMTDLNLPGASGLELAAEARALNPSTTIVFATGDPTAVRGETGAIVLAKPYDAAKLAEALATTGAYRIAEANPARSGAVEEDKV